MRVLRVSGRELDALLSSPYVDDELAETCALVVPVEDLAAVTIDAGSLPVVIVGVRHRAEVVQQPDAHDICDVVLDDGDPVVESILANIERHPLASTTLVVLLRSSTALPVDLALAAESSAYSVLQSGPEFGNWLVDKASRSTASPAEDSESPVVVSRDDSTLRIELNRPHRHNAFDRAMRDGLYSALAIVSVDASLQCVDISGRGPSFCSGGDLAEFGTLPDPATAHRVRLTRSTARLMHRVADRTTVHLHGACMGAGIELAAFARHVVAHPDARISLPEIGLGLIPGAGGTVSIPRRIGRQRTAVLALSGTPIDAGTALDWGLIDERQEATV